MQLYKVPSGGTGTGGNMSNTQRWIPVSERLPKKDQMCLVCRKGAITIDRYIGNPEPYKWAWIVSDYDAWMPLPEPYQEKEVNE